METTISILDDFTSSMYTEGSASRSSNTSIVRDGYCSIREFDIASLIIQLVISCVIILPNCAVVRVIFSGQSKLYRKPAYYLIASLAIADVIVAVYVIISVVIADVASVQMSALSWAVMYSCGSIPFYVSVLHLLVIAIDRLCFIGYNKIYQIYMSRRTVVFLITACWILALIPIIPVSLGIGACSRLCDCPNNGVLSCGDFKCSSIFSVYTKTYLFGNVFFFLFVMIIIILLYSMLFWKVHQKSRKVRGYCNTPAANTNSKRMMRECRLARTLAIVIFVFFACWGPLMIGYIIDYTLPFEHRIGEMIGNLLSIPNLINSISNPIIYAARMRHMRKALLPCSKKDRRRNQSASSSDSTLNTKGRLHSTLSTMFNSRKESLVITGERKTEHETARTTDNALNPWQFQTHSSSRTSRTSVASYGYNRGSYNHKSESPTPPDPRVEELAPLSAEFMKVFEDTESDC